MNVDVEKAIKPLRKLRSTLKDFPADPAPQDVHDLRTRARRLEAVVHALSSNSDHDARKLLKHAKPLRKAAGKVRDMDVFLAKLFALSDEPAGDGLLRLAEHLAGLRRKHGARLVRLVERHALRLRKLLKRYAERLEQIGGDLTTLPAPQLLASKLEHWPRLQQNNLHDFRIQAKELRYVLQLAPQPQPERMNALNAIRDAAGEWHDWVQLHAIAKEILDASADGEVLKNLETLVREKLRSALAAANSLRKAGICESGIA